LQRGKLASISKANKIEFPEKPRLTSLEERLISPRIPFMQIRELPKQRQLSIHGNTVNVFVDMSSTVNILTGRLSKTETVPTKMKRPYTSLSILECKAHDGFGSFELLSKKVNRLNERINEDEVRPNVLKSSKNWDSAVITNNLFACLRDNIRQIKDVRAKIFYNTDFVQIMRYLCQTCKQTCKDTGGSTTSFSKSGAWKTTSILTNRSSKLDMASLVANEKY